MTSSQDLEYYEFSAPVAEHVIEDPFVEIGDGYLAKVAIMVAGLYKFPVLYIAHRNGDEVVCNTFFHLVGNEILFTSSLGDDEGVFIGKHDMLVGTYETNYVSPTDLGHKVKDISFKLRKDFQEVVDKWVRPKELEYLIKHGRKYEFKI